MIFGFEEDFVCRFLVLVVWIFIIYNIIGVRIVGQLGYFDILEDIVQFVVNNYEVISFVVKIIK